MAEFLHDEAEEATTDEEIDDDDFSRKKEKTKKKKRQARIEDDDEDDEDEEMDHAAMEELKDFIQDEPEEDAPGAEDDHKRKHSDEELEMEDLEEDDYALLEENLGVKINRKKKRLRVKTMDDGSDEEDQDRNDRDAIASKLFEGGEEDTESIAPKSQPKTKRATLGDEDLDDEGEESDTDSFIVGDDGEPIHNKKRVNRYEDAALQEAQDIFGLDFDIEDITDLAEDDYDEEGEYEEEDEDGEPLKPMRHRKAKKSVMDVYEPSDLEHSLRTHFDNQIRMADIPERFQLRSIPVEAPPEDRAATELQEEARWIYHQLFVEPSLSHQNKAKRILMRLAGISVDEPIPKPETTGRVIGRGWVDPEYEVDDEHGPKPDLFPDIKTTRIKDILDFVRNQFLEDRFIATYRKEYYKDYERVTVKENDGTEKMALKMDQSSGKPIETEDSLHAEDVREVYEWDLKWMQLQQRRSNLLKLMLKMQEYLRIRRLENPESFEESDEISDETLDSIRNATDIAELSDIFSEFRMNFGQHVPSLSKLDTKKKPTVVKSEGENGVQSETLDESGNPVASEATNNDLSDIAAELAAEDQSAVAASTLKRARRTDPYVLCKEAGLDKFVAKFGMTAELFAKSVESDWQVSVPEQEEHEPEVAAEAFLSPRFSTPADVLNGSVFMMASLIARNAHLRRVVRRKYFDSCVINVEATSRGFKEIDENHPCYTIKFLSEKPIGLLACDQYLKLMQAKQEGQLEVTVAMPVKGGSDPFMTRLQTLFAVDEFRKETQAWNALRSRAVEKALKVFLYPAFAKEVHEKLLNEAKTYVKLRIRKNIYDWLNVAPYADILERKEKEENWEEGSWDLSKGVRVMGIAFENNWDQPGFAVVTDYYGDVIDSLKLPTLLNIRDRRGARVNPDDVDKICQFATEQKPHVICIAGESRRAIDIKNALMQALGNYRLNHQIPVQGIAVEIVDNKLSLLYQNSKVGSAEFPREHPLQRQAISIARRLLDPMVAFSQLFNMDDDLLNLNFHPLQNQLSKEELRNAVQIEFVKRVNDVGVDLNECVAHPLTHGNLVQFICGLGPRKAQRLLSLIKANGTIVSRNQLVMVCKLGPRVFINSAGFIRINVNELSDTVTGDVYIEPLDASRVHPETYDWARKMAVDAGEDNADEDDANPTDALQKILESEDGAAKLQQLDLDAFSMELERQSFGNKRITLNDIQQELMSRFKEMRTPYHTSSEEEIFAMVAGEDPSTYREGRMFTVTVTGFHYVQPRDENNSVDQPEKCLPKNDYFCPRCRTRGFPNPGAIYNHVDNKECPGIFIGVRVALDNGVTGMIPMKFLSNDHRVIPQERVKPGMVVLARLVKIEISKFLADFSCRTKDLTDLELVYKPAKDKYYDDQSEKAVEAKETKKLQKRVPKSNYVKRVISHPNFRNCDFKESEGIMRTLQPGDGIIRPSSKGNNKLTLSWKLAEGVYDHVEILEREKENVFSLGGKLSIGDETFEDLDEIFARYVIPMSQLVSDLMNHKYYVDSHFGQPAKHEAQRAIIDTWLRDEKAKAPQRIPFCFSICSFLPRKFFLCHLPRQNVREEFVTITPNGFMYRRNVFTSKERLLAYFKNHFHEPPPAMTTPGTGSMMITPSPLPGAVGRTPHMSTLASVAQNMPPEVWNRLRNVGASSNASATPVFATPRTPAVLPGSVGPAAHTPSNATPTNSSVAGAWGKAAQLWQEAMTAPGQNGPPAASPMTPSGVTPQQATPTSLANWSTAAGQWAALSMNPPATPVPDPGATPTAAAAAGAWMARRKQDKRMEDDRTPR